MKRKILSVALCLSMLVSLVAFAPFSFAVDTSEPFTMSEQNNNDASKDQSSEEQTAPQTDSSVADSQNQPAETPDANVPSDSQQGAENQEAEPAKPAPEANAPAEDGKQEPVPPAVNFTDVAKFVKARTAIKQFAMRALNPVSEPDNGVEFTKKVTPNEDGSYKIQLEAFTTGKVTVSTETKPSDIVLVLDKSSSMTNSFSDRETITEWIPVYKLNERKLYYAGVNHVRVRWCSNCSAWTNGCSGIFTHSPGTKYTPKTSEDSQGTQFYEKKVTTLPAMNRMQALKTSANKFVDSVSQNSPESNIAVVSFGRKGELLTTGGLINVKDNRDAIKSSINSISPNSSATEHGRGMVTAESVLSQSNPNNNRVVIMITDGEPAPYGVNNWSSRVVKQAVNTSLSLKNEGVSVYCVSVMPGTDASNPIKDMDKYMDYVSSNHPNATYDGIDLDNKDTNGDSYYTGRSSEIIKQITPGNKISTADGSFYLSASNVESLDKIFEQIASQSGGATTSLGKEAVIRDVITPYFTVPTKGDITIKQVDCVSYTEATNSIVWGNETTLDSSIVNIEGNTIDISGFDFDKNFVAEKGRQEGDPSKDGDFHGRKIVITFNVNPKPGFLGGNKVPTNEKAEVLKDANSTDPVDNAVANPVDVPINATLNVEVVDKNLYLHGSIDNEELKKDVVVKVNGKLFDELEPWQREFVKAPVSTVVGEVTKAENDSTYSATATLEPLYEGSSGAIKMETPVVGKINVFRPEVTYKDIHKFYGEVAPDANALLTEATASDVKWTHGEKVADSVNMIGTAPTIYRTAVLTTPDHVKNGVYATADDSYYKVTTKIGNTDIARFVINKHQDCAPKCNFVMAEGQFAVHKNTCTLDITKKVTDGGDDSFAMKVDGNSKAGFDPFEILVKDGQTVTLEGLPIGTYTVTEDADWAWKYTASGDNGKPVELIATNAKGSVTITNTPKNDKWLNFVTSVQNLFTGRKTN